MIDSMTQEARGAAARTQLLAVADKPLWNIWGDGLSSLSSHLHGPPVAFWMDDEDDEADPACGYTVTPEGIAVINIWGSLVDCEPTWWMSYLGYASLPAIARAVTAAAADGNVKDIFLSVKSPGGHVSGLAPVCDAVWAVRQAGEKRIWAGCSLVASAAYEIASQCDKMYLSADGMGGCIGTLYLLSDWSGYYSQMGVVKFRIASDGAETYKGAGATGTKITPAQQADYKRLCNEYRTLFNGVIQRGRGFSAETMAALADGRIHIGANALQLGLVDGIATPEAVLSALGGGDDLDDLEGSASQTPPDEDDDEDPSDTFHFLFMNSDLTNSDLISGALTGPDQENKDLSTQPKITAQPQNRMSAFLAWLGGEEAKNENNEETPTNGSAATAPSGSAPHPVLVAALSAGLDTPEKLQAVLDEQKSRQAAEKVSAEQALTDAKTAASNAAVTAFGQGSEKLTQAQALIAQQTSPDVLVSLTSAYQSVKPAQMKPDAKRQTATGQTQTAEEAGEGAADKVQEGLNPSNVYGARRAKSSRR